MLQCLTDHKVFLGLFTYLRYFRQFSNFCTDKTCGDYKMQFKVQHEINFDPVLRSCFVALDCYINCCCMVACTCSIYPIIQFVAFLIYCMHHMKSDYTDELFICYTVALYSKDNHNSY